MIYCDASVLVAIVVDEPLSGSADRWIRQQTNEGLAFSPWVRTEVASALAMKWRRGALDETGWRSAGEQVRRLLARFMELSIDPSHYAAAGERMVIAGSRGLRAGDALHLAIAAAHGATLASLDRDLNEAARSIGLAVAPVYTRDPV